MAESVNNRRIVLTGATGQLGRHVLAQLGGRSDAQVLVLVRSVSPSLSKAPNVNVRPVDFFRPEDIAAAFGEFNPTVVIHCAATGMLLPRPDWTELIQFNVNTSALLCQNAAKIPGCHFIHVSSGLAYRDQGRALREDDPLDSEHPYAATKIAAEAVLRAIAAEASLALTIVRPFSFTGPGDMGSRLFPSILRAAVEGKPLDLSPCEQVRDHCATEDVAKGILLGMENHSGPGGGLQVFNLASGSTVKLRSLLESLVAELELQVTLNFGARPVLPTEPKHLVADISHARQLLGWKPETNLSHAVWQLARSSFPQLRLKEPRQTIGSAPK